MKVEDRQLAKSVGVFAHPSLVIFRNYGEEAVIYSGDIKVSGMRVTRDSNPEKRNNSQISENQKLITQFQSQEAVLEWLLVQKDPTNEAIRDQEGDELQRTIERTESVAVFVCE